MKNSFLIILMLIIFNSCQDDLIDMNENNSESISVQIRSAFYDDYSDEESYSLNEFVALNHDEYGLNFISDNLNSVIDNSSLFSEADIDSVMQTKIKIKFRFRWNGCNPLGACLIITFGKAGVAPDLTESIVGVRGDKLIVIPQGSKNGMLSDGYIFVDPIEIGDDEADLLGIPRGSTIKSGIYKSKTSTTKYPYGYHVFNIIN